MTAARRSGDERAARAAPARRVPAAPAWLGRAALLAAFVAIALLATRQVGSLDIGFHLKAGQRILAGEGWPRTDPFTYTINDHVWIDTSWGYQAMAALVCRIFDAPGLVLLHAGLVLAVFFVLCRTARLGPADPITLAAVMLAGGVASEMRFETRPELVSWLLLALTLHLLHRHAEGMISPLPALAAIHLVWANMHALFVLGWIAIGCFVAGLWLRDRRLDRRLAGWGLASVAVTLINPYGWRGAIFPFTLATRLRESNVFGQSIGEFVSPFGLGLSAMFPFYPRAPIAAFRVLALLAVVSAVALIWQRRWWSGLLVSVFMALSFRMIRNIPLLVIAAAPGIVRALPAGALFSRLRGGARRAAATAALAALIVAAAALGLRVAHDAYYIASRRPERFGLGWNRLALPMDAAAWANGAKPPGRMLNHLNFGGYLMWAGGLPVFIDGRLEVTGEEFYKEYERVMTTPAALEAAVAKHGIGWIVFPYAISRDLLVRLSKDPRWRLAYVDQLAAIFVRTAAPEPAGGGAPPPLPPASIPGLALEAAPPPLASLPGIAGNPRPGPAARWLEGLARRQRFPSEDFSLGLFHYFRGEIPAARARFALAVSESGGAWYEIYQNLGAALYQEKRPGEAADCYRVVLSEDPDNRVARERLAAIEARR